MKNTGILNFISRNKLCTKAISMFLALVLIFYFIPTVIYAEIAEAISSIELGGADVTASSDSEAVYEDISKREASVKHFRLSDGTYIAMQYASDVHYINDEGAFEDIDNSLSEAAGSVYANPDSRIKFAKKTTGNGVLFTLKEGSTKLTLSLIGANKGIYGQITNYSDDENDTMLGKMSKLEKLTSKILYPEILDGVDLEYIAHSLSIKENIIVKEKKDSYSYSFELKLNGMTAELVASGDIEITEDTTSEIKYIIPAPIVYDAEYTYAPEGAAAYSLTDGGNGKYTLTVNMSSEWMNAEDRAYPVTIDPTIGAQRNTMVDTHISPSAPTAGNYNTNPLRVSGNHNLYFTFRSLPTIPAGSYISNASVGFTASTVTSPIKIAAYAATTSWLTGLTYNSHLNQGKGILDAKIQDMQNVSTAGQIYRFDITNLMRGWYDDASTLFGFALKVLPNQGYTAATYAEFYSLENGYDYPKLALTYRDITGVEGYYSYSSHSAGLAGTGNINLATGSLNFAIPTLSTTDGLMPYTVRLVYNSEMAGKEYNSTYANVAYSTARTPLGMMLNIGESVVTEYFTNALGHSFGGIIYFDADGTENVFVYDVDDDCYYDEEGAPVTINKTLEQVEYTDSSKVKRTFTKVASGVSWVLSRIEDISGNAVVFTLDTSYRPTVVSLDPAGDVAAIPMLELSYSSDGRLSMIYNPTTYEAVILRYSATYDGAVVTSGGKYLKSIDFARGDETTTDANWESYIASSSAMTNIFHAGSASYAYNSAGYLISVSDDREIHRLDYTLSGVKYNSITEYAGASSLEGQRIAIFYYNDCTDVVTNGNDAEHWSADDLTTRYIFDDYARAISTYTYSNDRAIYGAVTGKYSEEEGSKNNLEQKTVLGGISVNYLYNGGFESWTSATAANGWTLSGAAVRAASYNYLLGGHYALGFYTGENGTAYASQRVTLNSGTYTLSFPYLSADCEDTVVTVTIESVANTSVDVTETLELNRTYEDPVESYFSTVFDVTADNTVIDITVTTVSGVNAAQPIIEIPGIMLEHGIGGSSISLVNYGAFEETATAELSDVWSDYASLEILSPGLYPFGDCLKVENENGMAAYVGQTIYEIPETELQKYNNGTFKGNGGHLVVSGFAMQSGSILSAAGSFAIKVNIAYYQGAGKSDVVRTYTLPFITSLDSWQFGSITINTKKDGITPNENGTDTNDYSCIRYIDILCDYSDQPMGYALFDNISAVWDSYNTVDYSYDENGQVIEKSTPAASEYYIYDSNNNLTRYANTNGNVIDYTYNALNQPHITTVSEVSIQGDYTRDDFLNGSVTLTPKTTTTYSYTPQGLISNEVTQYSGAVKKIQKVYSYDLSANAVLFGKLLMERDMSGSITRYIYDYEYGRLSAVLTAFDISGVGVAYEYDQLGRLVNVLPAKSNDITEDGYFYYLNNAGIEYTYDQKGRLSTIYTGSVTYTFGYDDYGNLIYVDGGETRLITYNYASSNGKLTSVVYANGKIEEYVYNDLEMLTEIWYTVDDETIFAHKYEYNADGTLYKYINYESGKATIYKYSLDGEISSVSEADITNGDINFTTGLIYDDKTGDLIQLSYGIVYDSPNGYLVKEDQTYYYTYNVDGSLKRTALGSGTALNYSTTFTRDGYSRVTQASTVFRANNKTVSFQGSEAYTYESLGEYDSSRVKTYTVTKGNYSTTYTFNYDYREYITSIVATGSESYRIKYVYDDLGQLVRENNEKLGKTFIYSYDNAGNITETKAYAYTTSSAAPSGAYTTETYTYSSSNWGDLLTVFNGSAITYDALGNPLTYYNNRTFAWEGRQMISATTASGSLYFKHNDNGLRVSKIKNGVETTYYYDGTRLISEQNQNETILYVYDDTGIVIGMQYRLTTYAEDTWDVYWFERNLQGDIVAVYNTAGTKLISYTYDAWGNFTTVYSNGGENTTAVKNPFRYRGYYYDSDLQLYYLQTRYYDSVTGRFISPDDISYLGANGDLNSFNLYAYCSNNPVMYTDPSGHFIISLSTLLLGVAISAGVGALISFGTSLYADYQDDGEIFNGSVGVDEYIGNTAGGLIAGAGIGACTVLGAGLGAAMAAGEALVVCGVTLSGAAAFGLGTGTAFVAGGASYTARTLIGGKDTFQYSDMLIESVANTASGALSFVGGMCGGITGVKVPGVSGSFGDFARYHAGMSVFGVYPLKPLISVIKKALQGVFE